MLWLYRKPFVFFSPDPDAGGGSGGKTGEGDDGKKGSGEGGGDGDKKSYTQAELDVMFGERAKQAKSSTTADILKALGVEKIEDAKAILDAKRQADEDQKTELEKAKEAVKAANEKTAATLAEAEKIKAEAAEKLMKAEVEKVAVGAGFRPEASGDVWLVVDKTKITVDDSGNYKGIKEAVDLVAKEKPFWLLDPKGSPPKGRGTPGGGGSNNKPGSSQNQNQNNNNTNPPTRVFTL
jgi:hypothetical protein